VKPRVYAARIAARLMLQKIWATSNSGDKFEVLRTAPESAARELGVTLDLLPSIGYETKIAGVLDRSSKRILLATKFNFTSQRFTLAHEVGHFLLHPGQIYFRDRELSAPGENARPYYEIEADAFAAEFLMPRKFLDQIFRRCFGSPVGGSVPNVALAQAVSRKMGRTWTPQELAETSPWNRAAAVAAAHSYNGKFFESLAQQFAVSKRAMGIQLLQMELVR
jgi:Zn-dependent peptidase ImmA (M78 family)